MPTIHDALSLASQGWQVLPLRGKIPLTAHGVKDASNDPEHVAQWWAHAAPHNIGARVPGHLMVLDLDPRNGGTLDVLEAANGGPLPPTLTAYSGRGDGGQHLYFLHPGGKPSARLLPDGIDIKTDTGYCVVPPSLHPETGRPYRWGEHGTPARLPDRLRQLVLPPTPRPAPANFAPGGPQDRDRLTRRGLHLARHMSQATEGQRNERLHWAYCEAIRTGYPPEVFKAITDAARSVGLDDAEIARTHASARRSVGGVQ